VTVNVGFIGLGRMGTPMAENVVAAGFPVCVYARRSEKAKEAAELMGVSVALSPREVGTSAEVIILMVSDEPAVRAVLDGSDGLLAGLREGAIVVDMGTTGISGTRWLAEAVKSKGAHLVDAPVSGSTASATAATLTIMAGGAPETMERVRPILEAMGGSLYYMGESGTGAAMKLAVNAVIFALGQAVSEALVLAEKTGVSRETAYDVFENSAVAAPMVKYRRAAFLTPETTPTAFDLNLANKDLGLIQELASSVGANMPQADVNRQLIVEAIAAGYGDSDMAGMAVFLRSGGTSV